MSFSLPFSVHSLFIIFLSLLLSLLSLVCLSIFLFFFQYQCHNAVLIKVDLFIRSLALNWGRSIKGRKCSKKFIEKFETFKCNLYNFQHRSDKVRLNGCKVTGMTNRECVSAVQALVHQKGLLLFVCIHL